MKYRVLIEGREVRGSIGVSWEYIKDLEVEF